jgi:ectoine hydroxylase-related dioxygenase (phytanoyl-CoA dioxygenase family)
MLDPLAITGNARESVEEHVARIQKDGYTIAHRAIEPALIDALYEDLLRLERDLGIVPATNRFEGRQTLRIYNLLVHGELYPRIPVHESVLPIVCGVLDEGCLISSLSSIAILPGERPQPIHADDQLIPIPRPHPPLVCNTMWAITDFTTENGATRIVPGSHLREDVPVYKQEVETIAAEMPKGSVLIYNGSLWHGGGENRSGARRVGIAMNYCAGYIRQQENQQLGVPREIARTFSPRLRELLGYSVYHNVIGHIDKCHPGRLLDEDVDPRDLAKGKRLF